MWRSSLWFLVSSFLHSNNCCHFSFPVCIGLYIIINGCQQLHYLRQTTSCTASIIFLSFCRKDKKLNQSSGCCHTIPPPSPNHSDLLAEGIDTSCFVVGICWWCYLMLQNHQVFPQPNKRSELILDCSFVKVSSVSHLSLSHFCFVSSVQQLLLLLLLVHL